MSKHLIVLTLTILISSCTSTAEKERIALMEHHSNTLKDFREQGISYKEFDFIVNKTKRYMQYNTYLTGKLNDMEIFIDLYNSEVAKNTNSILFPITIINYSKNILYLNQLTDKLFFLVSRDNDLKSYRLHLLAIPYKILPDEEITFIAKFNFKNTEEMVGYNISLNFLKIYIDSLNGSKVPVKNDIAKHEVQMKKTWNGKFERKELGISIPLSYKIIQR